MSKDEHHDLDPALEGHDTRRVQAFLLLSENWTMADPRDLRRLVEYSVVAEEAGLDGVVVGEHVVMGPNAGRHGAPVNPRDWMGAYNQCPTQPHPSSLVLLSAIASATRTLRIVAGAALTALHHPLVLAKELATLDLLSEGRLVVMPSVSWQEEEYAALGVPFDRRGEILDEQLQIWQRLWTDGSPVRFSGAHFRFDDVFVEPQPFRRGGPHLWFGGDAAAPWTVRRTLRYGSGLFPIGLHAAAQLESLRQAMTDGGRDFDALELCSFVQGNRFVSAADLLDLAGVMESVPDLLRLGVTTLVVKPSQFIDDDRYLPDFCRRLRTRVDEAAERLRSGTRD